MATIHCGREIQWYDHRFPDTRSTYQDCVIRAARDLSDLNLTLQQIGVVEDVVGRLRDVDRSEPILLFAHATGVDWDSIVKSARERDICVRMASDGGVRIPGDQALDSRDVYQFGLLRPLDDVTFDQWKKVLRGFFTEGLAEELACEQGGELRSLFFSCNSDILNALAILCQGFLVAHADPETGAPIMSRGALSYDVCREALSAMGCGSLVSQADVDSPQALCADRGGIAEQVARPQWWDVFEGVDVIRLAKQEWSRQRCDGWGELESLLRVLRDQRETTVGEVARAYLALARRLSLAEGKT